MTTNAELGIGSLLQYGDDSASPESFTTLDEALDIQIGTSREQLEVTNQDSPNQAREYIAGLKEDDEFTVECNFLPSSTSQQATIAMQESGAARTWRLFESLTGGGNRDTRFEAIVTAYQISTPVAGQKTISFTFRITGGITRWNWPA